MNPEPRTMRRRPRLKLWCAHCGKPLIDDRLDFCTERCRRQAAVEMTNDLSESERE